MKRKFTLRSNVAPKFYISPNFNDTAYLRIFRNETTQYMKNSEIGEISQNSYDSWHKTFNLTEVSESIAKKRMKSKFGLGL